MPEPIFETVVTTCAPDGAVHVAPMGVRYRDDRVVLMPFRPSTTLANIEATGCAVLNLTTDVRIFAGCVTGIRRDWPTVVIDDEAAAAMAGGAAFHGVRLAAALGHVALRLLEQRDDPQRPLLSLGRIHEAQHAPFIGMNRAQAAVLEGAVLVSRLQLLPADKIDREFGYLQIAIDKTAGADELDAWGWLQQAIRRHRDGTGGRAGAADLDRKP